MALPLISVIVPIYNVEAYLPRCVTSILVQTYEKLEVILVDDGSTDNCGKLCDEYAQQDDRVRVIHQENGGISHARNVGLNACTGQMLMFIDSDDYIPGNAIEILYDRMMADNSDMAVGQSVCVDPISGNTAPWSHFEADKVLTREEVFSQLGTKENVPCSLWGKLYRRAIYEGITFPEMSCGEDLWVFPDMLEKCERISILTGTVYFYLVRGTSTMNTLNEEKRQMEVEAGLHVANHLLRRGNSVNAGIYFRTALERSMHVQDKRRMLSLIRESIPMKKRTRYIVGDARSCARWICLQIPVLHKVYRRVFGAK